MKTITMDYALYEKELLEAKQDGVLLSSEIIKEFPGIISDIQSHNREVYDRALFKLSKLNQRLTTLEQKKPEADV